MTREMYVSSTPHETKVALVEDDELTELFFERENEYTLAGSIYKGRVTRVLPGMQSAFVDIGLERDAFLYVSDFLEVPEDVDSEFEEIAVEAPLADMSVPPAGRPMVSDAAAPEQETAADETALESWDESPDEETPEGNTQEFAPAEASAGVEREFRGNRRRRRSRRRGFPETKFAQSQPSSVADSTAPSEWKPADLDDDIDEPPSSSLGLLPGESIAKYQSPVAASKRQQSPAVSSQAPVANSSTMEGAAGAREQVTDERRPAAFVLPGESLAKYQSREAARQTPAGESGVAAVVQPQQQVVAEEPATPKRRMDSAAIGVLPGESIAKYHSPAPLPLSTPSSVLEGDSGLPETAVVAENPASPAEGFVETEADGTDSPERTERITIMNSLLKNNGEFSTTAGLREPVQEAEERSGTFVIESEPWMEELSPVVGRQSPEISRQAEQVGREELATDGLSLTTDSEHAFGAPGTGTLEHEEIEGDEAESHVMLPEEEEEDDADFFELEEELFDHQNQSPERLRAERAVTGEAAPEDARIAADFDEDLAFEEHEVMEQDGSGESREWLDIPSGDPIDEAEGTRAEVRGPSGTSGFRSERSYGPARQPGDRSRPFPARRGRRGMAPRRSQAPRQTVQISDVLKEGQEVLVQIAKEPIGKKGARITSHIALPGRFLVYMPTVNHIGVSRKITGDDERLRLKRIMLSEREGGRGGFIVRTAAAGVGEDELRADIRFLKNLWQQIKQRSDNGKAPALIYHDLNLVERILRDLVSAEFSQIWVDSEREYEHILNFANRFQPALVRRVKLYTREVPLFEQFGLQEEMNKALKSKVWLKSGGHIVINQTEALVAIDVNTGKYVGKTARLEDTIVKTNVDAIREIVRQIRLRDLGGIIIIDFIDMDERKNRQRVMQALDEALRYDRSPSKVLAFNDFGLVALTRKRVKQSLERTLSTPCPYCSGNGLVKSVVTVCNEIYTELRKMRRHLDDTDVVNLRVNPEIAKAIKADNGKWLQDFEELTGRTVLVKPDALLHQEQFDIS